MNTALPRHVYSLDEFVNWMALQSGKLPSFADQIRELIEKSRDHDQLCEDLRTAIDHSDIDQPKDATLQRGLDEIVERYHHVRAEFNEWFDHDIAEAAYRDETTHIVKNAHSDGEFRDKVRATLVETTALAPDAGDDYAMQLLRALLGLPLA